jgi:secernin
MCDTLVALPATSSSGSLLFAKNSDRQRNEAHLLEWLPRSDHVMGASVMCTYVSIAQACRTNAVLLCRPFWTWGAEMGANEHGVVIGNEGLFARVPAPEEEALTGMDLVRLGLERGETAAEALSVITMLLERHGQGGNCGHLVPSYYHNGFMIADAHEAFVLETVGREWLVERVQGVRAISNRYSIGCNVDRMSGGLSQLLEDAGWRGSIPIDYAEALSDPQTAHIGSARARRQRATSLLEAASGHLGFADMARILRDHEPTGRTEAEWNPRSATRYSLCIHAGGEDQRGQSTGSMASEIYPGDAVHWVTGTAAPCISIFKPTLMDVPLPPHGPRPTDRFDANALWWRHEWLHRMALKGSLPEFIAEISRERNALESAFHDRMMEVLNGGSTADRSSAVAVCWQEAIDMEYRRLARVTVVSPSGDDPYTSAWREMSSLAGMPAPSN